MKRENVFMVLDIHLKIIDCGGDCGTVTVGIFTLGYAQSAALSDMVKNHRVPFYSPKFNQHSRIQPHAKFFLQPKAAYYHT